MFFMLTSTHRKVVTELREQISDLNATNLSLSRQLESARLNDRRDPKTQKFVNAKTGTNTPKKKKK